MGCWAISRSFYIWMGCGSSGYTEWPLESVRTQLRGFLRLGGVRIDLAVIGPLAAYVRFGVFSATRCTRHM